MALSRAVESVLRSQGPQGQRVQQVLQKTSRCLGLPLVPRTFGLRTSLTLLHLSHPSQSLRTSSQQQRSGIQVFQVAGTLGSLYCLLNCLQTKSIFVYLFVDAQTLVDPSHRIPCSSFLLTTTMDPFSSLANSLEALKLRLATASSPEERKQVYEDALQDAHRLVDDLQQRLGGLGAEFQHSPAPEDKLKDTVHALEGTNTSSKVEGSVVQPCDSTAVEKSPERVELPLFNDVKCANISTESHQSITDKVCGACRLVTYCSEVSSVQSARKEFEEVLAHTLAYQACQKSHWTQHKKGDFPPTPTLCQEEDSEEPSAQTARARFAKPTGSRLGSSKSVHQSSSTRLLTILLTDGTRLTNLDEACTCASSVPSSLRRFLPTSLLLTQVSRWGNMPANDILNLKCNEVNVDSQDLAMAFIGAFGFHWFRVLGGRRDHGSLA